MVALPVLAGALLRVVFGVLVDRLQPRRAGIIGQVIVIGGPGLRLAPRHSHVCGHARARADSRCRGRIVRGGVAARLALVSAAVPGRGARHRGRRQFRHGVRVALRAGHRRRASAGTTCSGSRRFRSAVAFIVYLFAAKDSPTAPPPKKWSEYLAVLRMSDAWWFMFFYSVTFGGFVGLASSLAIYFNTEYGLDAVKAGYFTAGCVFVGSLVRPIGGALADRIGGIKTLTTMYAIAALMLVIVSFRPSNVYTALDAVRRRACSRSAWGMARCFSWCRSGFVMRSA